MATGRLRVSIGQAGCNALAGWLRSQLPSDVSVIPNWPEPSVTMFAPGRDGLPQSRAVVSITKVGRRERDNIAQAFAVEGRSDFTAPAGSPPNARVTFRIGSFIQPAQIDIWATNEDDRDDIIDRLDDALTAGADKSLANTPYSVGVTDDPVRDEVLVGLLAADGYSGIVVCWFDEPDITDTPDRVQQGEYRCTYFGQIRGDFTRTKIVPRLVAQELKAQVYDNTATAPATSVLLYDTTTITVQANVPPPGPKVTKGTST